MLTERMLVGATERLVTVNAGSSLREAAKLMSKPHVHLVVVCDDQGGMVGVLTKTDIVRRIGSCVGEGCAMARVDSIMTRDVAACRPGDALGEVWAMMRGLGLQCVPVVDRFRGPVGIIHARDAQQSLLDEAQYEEALLRDYVMTVGYR